MTNEQYSQILEGILDELSVRIDEGIVDLQNPKHLQKLGEIFDEMELYQVGDQLIENLMREDEDDDYTHLGAGIYVAKRDVDPDGGAKKGAQKYRKDGEGEQATFSAISDEEAEEIRQKQGDAGEKAAASFNQQQAKDGGQGGGEGEEQERGGSVDPSTPDGKAYTDQLPPDDPASTSKKGEKQDQRPKPEIENIGKTFGEEGEGDTVTKNQMMEFGYNNFEENTGSKPAPGGAGSAYNEIVSGEGIHVLDQNSDMTEEELSDYLQKKYGNTNLGKEQKETGGVPRNPEIEKRRKEAIGNGKTSKPEFPEEYTKVEQERSTYTKSRIAARSAITKYKKTKQRVRNLQEGGKFGTQTKLHTFYGADTSIQSQVEMVEGAHKVYLPNGTEVQKDDLVTFIKAGGGGMNPSDTATFVTDENGNLLVQFHSDKTTTGDIQDNSTLSFESQNYLSYIDDLDLPDDEKQEAQKIVEEISQEINKIEEQYTNQSQPIASNLGQIDRKRQVDIIERDKGTLKKNLKTAIYGKRGIKSQYLNYVPEGADPENLTLNQEYEMIRRLVSDGKGGSGDAKVINKVALALQKEDSSIQGIDVKKILSEQRERVVTLQRERVNRLNQFQARVGDTPVELGTLMEANETIRGFHLSMMDYPPKTYTPGNPSSIAGAGLDVNMGGTNVDGQTMSECIGVDSTEDFKKYFRLEETDELQYDNQGNVTGKKVFTYAIDKEGKRIEIGYKTYRSKTGATGKTNNTMSYSKEMQDCFKSKQS